MSRKETQHVGRKEGWRERVIYYPYIGALAEFQVVFTDFSRLSCSNLIRKTEHVTRNIVFLLSPRSVLLNTVIIFIARKFIKIWELLNAIIVSRRKRFNLLFPLGNRFHFQFQSFSGKTDLRVPEGSYQSHPELFNRFRTIYTHLNNYYLLVLYLF